MCDTVRTTLDVVFCFDTDGDGSGSLLLGVSLRGRRGGRASGVYRVCRCFPNTSFFPISTFAIGAVRVDSLTSRAVCIGSSPLDNGVRSSPGKSRRIPSASTSSMRTSLGAVMSPSPHFRPTSRQRARPSSSAPSTHVAYLLRVLHTEAHDWQRYSVVIEYEQGCSQSIQSSREGNVCVLAACLSWAVMDRPMLRGTGSARSKFRLTYLSETSRALRVRRFAGVMVPSMP